ncbi:MAG: DUF6671 family protein [Deltaproteobacteria bacterium]|nr:DUF6671 family protein [Deltaproteobacteria bacterium]
MSESCAADSYRGKRFSLLTQHGKERVMSPLFAESFGATLAVATGFDTDSLGSFTRDITRHGNQLEAARKKAEKGMDLLDLPCGIASEGSFGPAPFGFFPWNIELVFLVDRARGIEIVGRAQGMARHLHEQVATRGALDAFAHRAGFPGHGLVVRPDGENDPRIRKGLVEWPLLHAAFDEALAQSSSCTVFIESDLRAHMNPTRMEMIRTATGNLIERMKSECPQCGAPGFWILEQIAGLPCRDCDLPTGEARAERWGCVAADHFEIREVGEGRLGDPSRCDRCNP